MDLLQHLVDALSLGSRYALAALGIALVFSIMRLVNFAHGEIIMISAYAAWATASLGWPVTVLAALAAGGLLAVIMERVAFRPVRGASAVTLLITSFAVGFLLQSLVRLTLGAKPKSAAIFDQINRAIEIAGVRIALLDLVTLVVTVALMLLVASFLARTASGRQMRAAAEDFEMAKMVGVRANRVIALAFLISGLLAGVAGLLTLASTGTAYPTMGLAPLLAGVVAIVIGGIGSMPGAVAGAYLLGAVTVLFQIVLPDYLIPYRDAFAFIAVIVLIVAVPRGLFASSSSLGTRV